MKTVLRFIACSDLHYKDGVDTEPERFKKGMQCAYRYADAEEYKPIDAIFIIGDFANSGKESEMLAVRQSLDLYVRPETLRMLMVASHEFGCPDREEGAYRRLKEIFGLDQDNHVVIGGYHFISVSTERGCRFGEAKRAWIDEQLKIASADGRKKPIFFFQHPHLTDTVYGSIDWGEKDITAVLMNYPQVIDFSGHSHAPVNDPRSIYQKYFTAVGTGSLSYFELDDYDFTDGTVPKDKEFCAQFLVVEVRDDNSVLIKPFDILSGEFFNDGYLVERAWDPASFVYTDARYRTEKAPVFAEGTPIDISFADGRLTVCFGQAVTEPERPASYTIVIKDASDGSILKQVKIPSSYYIYDMPKTLCEDFAFDEKGSFICEIYANSFWKTVSAPITKAFHV